MATELRGLRGRLFAPTDAASLGAFRIAFGILMAIATARFFTHGWIAEYYLQPTHFFTYQGFGWVAPWPGAGMYIHFGAMLVCAILIAAGVFYRVAIIAFGLLFTYAHLIDKTHYLNHYYLVTCLCGLMACMPLDRAFALRGTRGDVPAWMLWAIRAQVGLVYLYGGIAKLGPDWLVDAQPMTIWLAMNTDVPLVGRWLGEPWVAHVASLAGAAFDLAIVPLLLWRRTRVLAYALVVFFHLATLRLFQLGMFPWIMMASSLIFLPPGWPRALLRRLARAPAAPSPALPLARPRHPRLTTTLLGIYFAIQVLVPLRHWLYPGDVLWTEEGYRFAWHVMRMEKDGSLELHVTEPTTGRHWEVAPDDYLTRYQVRMAAPQPDMILQLAHMVAADFRARGIRDPEVRVDAFAALNGKRRARLIDPHVDLARESDGFAPTSWILPRP